MPLSELRTKKAKPRLKGKAKQTTSATPAPSHDPQPALSDRFFDMIKNDDELYLRILRYEVSRSSTKQLPFPSIHIPLPTFHYSS
jgi:hypothetical protein